MNAEDDNDELRDTILSMPVDARVRFILLLGKGDLALDPVQVYG